MTTTTPQDQIIPAAVGHSVLRFTFLDRKVNPDFVASGEALEVRPIVAWQIVGGAVLPIALGLGDPPASGCVEAVILPSGMIFDLNGKSWRSLAAWSQDVAAAWRAWRAEHHPPALPAAVAPPSSLIAGIVGASGTTSFMIGTHERIDA